MILTPTIGVDNRSGRHLPAGSGWRTTWLIDSWNSVVCPSWSMPSWRVGRIDAGFANAPQANSVKSWKSPRDPSDARFGRFRKRDLSRFTKTGRPGHTNSCTVRPLVSTVRTLVAARRTPMAARRPPMAARRPPMAARRTLVATPLLTIKKIFKTVIKKSKTLSSGQKGKTIPLRPTARMCRSLRNSTARNSGRPGWNGLRIGESADSPPHHVRSTPNSRSLPSGARPPPSNRSI